MTLATGLQVVEKLFDLAVQNRHPWVKLKYAGGEPTLEWDLMTALHEHALDLAQQLDISLTEILVTNGIALSRSRLEYLQSEGIRLSYSLDGFGVGHDTQRPMVNGLPSFKPAYHLLQTALELGLHPYLTITLTRLNLEDLPAITQFALEHRLFLNWNFYRPYSAADSLAAERGELIAALGKGLQVIEQNLPNYPFLDKLIDRSNFGIPHDHTCGAGSNYISIDCDGSALPCHMLSGRNQVGIPLMDLESAGFEQFENLPVDEREGCQVCEWRYWCAGGCPILAQLPDRNAEAKPYYCDVYKAIYPRILMLMQMQSLSADAIRAP
jgi:uncharacterized protein